MSQRFHVTPKGQVRQCKAAGGGCPYGAEDHADSREAAEKRRDEKMRVEHGSGLSGVRKGSESTLDNPWLKKTKAEATAAVKTIDSPEELRKVFEAMEERNGCNAVDSNLVLNPATPTDVLEKLYRKKSYGESKSNLAREDALYRIFKHPNFDSEYVDYRNPGDVVAYFYASGHQLPRSAIFGKERFLTSLRAVAQKNRELGGYNETSRYVLEKMLYSYAKKYGTGDFSSEEKSQLVYFHGEAGVKEILDTPGYDLDQFKEDFDDGVFNDDMFSSDSATERISRASSNPEYLNYAANREIDRCYTELERGSTYESRAFTDGIWRVENLDGDTLDRAARLTVASENSNPYLRIPLRPQMRKDTVEFLTAHNRNFRVDRKLAEMKPEAKSAIESWKKSRKVEDQGYYRSNHRATVTYNPSEARSLGIDAESLSMALTGSPDLIKDSNFDSGVVEYYFDTSG